ncbi:hypothetical protein B0T12DRAFT_261258 [Alternaria alternata]|nr:hypothetical protein B0T12DRAFT_261258 [Alternaria alternata]
MLLSFLQGVLHSLCLRRSVSSHAFVRYLLYFPWSEYKNRYHFSNPMHLIHHESVTLHLLPPVMMMLSTTDKSRGSERRNVWS